MHLLALRAPDEYRRMGEPYPAEKGRHTSLAWGFGRFRPRLDDKRRLKSASDASAALYQAVQTRLNIPRITL